MKFAFGSLNGTRSSEFCAQQQVFHKIKVQTSIRLTESIDSKENRVITQSLPLLTELTEFIKPSVRTSKFDLSVHYGIVPNFGIQSIVKR